MKKNLLFIVLIVILSLISLYYCFHEINSYHKHQQAHDQIVELCASGVVTDLNFCDNFDSRKIEYDYITLFANIQYNGIFKFNILYIVATIIVAVYYASYIFRNNGILHELTRIKYKKFLCKIFLQSYKAIFIIPLAVCLPMLVSILYIGSLTIGYYFEYPGFWEFTTVTHQCFIIMYIVNCFIHSILYTNIGLCVVRKQHNLFLSVILALLIIIGVEAFLEIFVSGIILNSIMHTEVGIIFNIMNFMAFNDIFGMGSCMIVPTVLMLISCGLVYLSYKNKEKLIIDCEKNDREEDL